jgi:dTDP-4-dehydrorhamnose 3,5-epimerase
MKKIKTTLKNLFIIQNDPFIDNRGDLLKVYNSDIFYKKLKLNIEFKESYFSTSRKNVLRGMHFQKFPESTIKLISIINGSILDVVVNINKDSDQFGQFYYLYLDRNLGRSLYIGEDYAHGFLSLENNTVVNCMMNMEYNQKYDAGIRFDSFGFDWSVQEKNLILSDRDKNLIGLSEL